MEGIEKWLASYEEESSLEDYNKVNMTRTRDREIFCQRFPLIVNKRVDIDGSGKMKTGAMQAEVHALP